MSYTWNSYPNIPFMNILPCGISNYGGDTQVYTLDPDEIGAAAAPTVMLNPIATALLNQRTMQPLMPQINMPSQEQINEQAEKIANNIVNGINNNMLKQSLSVSAQNLATQKTKLNALLANPDLPEADKAEVNRLLDKIQEEERKINELSKKMADMDSGEALKEAQDIEKEIRTIVTDANKIKTPEAPKKDETKPQEESQGGVLNTPDTTAQQGQVAQSPALTPAQQQDGVPQTTTQQQVDGQAAPQATGKITDEQRQIADIFHDAIAGLGTDDTTFNALFDEGVINKDNIVEVMAAYEEAYGTSFMDDFMDDADSGFFCAGGQKVKYGKAIARMLRSRAISAGVYNESKEDLQAINKEMDSTFYVSNGIYQNYDNVAALIAAKENIA